MTTNWKDLARATLEDSVSGTMTFPQNLRILMEAGFDGYAVDFRRSTRTYYLPNGEAFKLKTAPTPTPVAETFDASVVKEALREAQLAFLHANATQGAGSEASERGFKKATTPAAEWKDIGYAHPFYWAPFVLIGNYR